MIGDMQDILDGGEGIPQASSQLDAQAIMHSDSHKKKKSSKKSTEGAIFRRPEGMHRELYALISDKPEVGAPIVPSYSVHSAYKTSKAKLGLKHVRQWKLTPFRNNAREDSLELVHWHRADKPQEEYPFAKFNKSLDCPEFSDSEYDRLLTVTAWTKEETHHLLDLCKRFDLRWPVIVDRWDREKFTQKRSMEDLKERYYNICNAIIKFRCKGVMDIQQPDVFCFDAQGERKRKEQMEKLWNRTEEQIEEEEHLVNELRSIQARRKERERKAQDLQKLINSAERPSVPSTPGPCPSPSGLSSLGFKKKQARVGRPSNTTNPVSPFVGLEANVGIKWPEFKGPGTHLRSQQLKLLQGIGQKKMKAVEQAVEKLNLEWNPMPTEEICGEFNKLRSDIGVLYELKSTMSVCEYELQTLKVKYMEETGQDLEIPAHLRFTAGNEDGEDGDGSSASADASANDVANNITPRKRKAAMEQCSLLKKMRKS